MDPNAGIKKKFRDNLIKKHANFLDDKLFLEFGVMQGHSLVDFYNAYKTENIKGKFFGFDSFLGLPEEKNDEHSPWATGKFSIGGIDGVLPEVMNNKDMTIVDGWFSDTLTDSVVEKFDGKKIGIVHIDCDIYTSTVEVLEFIIKNDLLCDGSILLYDDWGAYRQSNLSEEYEYSVAEAKAHREIAEKYDLEFELLQKEVIDPAYYIMSVFKYHKKNKNNS